MKSLRFFQLDVFATQSLTGNPLAVFLDAEELSTEKMQQIAHWTGLSETTFLLPPTPEGAAAGADYRVRIFNPRDEMKFAGHPTLGSAKAWLLAGNKPQQEGMLKQECGVGIVPVRMDGDRLAFSAPPFQLSEVPRNLFPELIGALGIPEKNVIAAKILNNGPEFYVVMVDDQNLVLDCDPNISELIRLDVLVGLLSKVTKPEEVSEPFQLEVRLFTAPVGVLEDPITGSMNASIAQWLIGEGKMPANYVARQGKTMGRDGRVYINSIARDIWVGGKALPLLSGEMSL